MQVPVLYLNSGKSQAVVAVTVVVSVEVIVEVVHAVIVDGDSVIGTVSVAVLASSVDVAVIVSVVVIKTVQDEGVGLGLRGASLAPGRGVACASRVK